MEGYNRRFIASTPTQQPPFNLIRTRSSEWWSGLNIRSPMITQPLPPLPVGEFRTINSQGQSPYPTNISHPQSNFTPQMLATGNGGNGGLLLNANTRNNCASLSSEPQIQLLPPAMAKYKLVVADKNVFFITLQKLHQDIKNKNLVYVRFFFFFPNIIKTDSNKTE